VSTITSERGLPAFHHLKQELQQQPKKWWANGVEKGPTAPQTCIDSARLLASAVMTSPILPICATRQHQPSITPLQFLARFSVFLFSPSGVHCHTEHNSPERNKHRHDAEHSRRQLLCTALPSRTRHGRTYCRRASGPEGRRLAIRNRRWDYRSHCPDPRHHRLP